MAKGNVTNNPDINPDIGLSKNTYDNPDVIADAQIDASDKFGISDSESKLPEDGYITTCIPSRPDADDNEDFVCCINGKKYRIPIGEEVKVPKFVWEFYLNHCKDVKKQSAKKKAMSDMAKDI